MGDDLTKKTNLAAIILLILCLIGIGTLGYMFIEGWNFLDALYMVVITIATVGFKEVHDLSPAGMVFTILLIVFGLTLIYYVARVAGEYILENKLEEHLKYKRMDKAIKHLTGHYIVCGFGRVGKQVVKELLGEKQTFLVIEKNPTLAAECEAEGHLCLVGDSTEEDVLAKAGILNAKSLIVCLGSDSDAVLTVVTAKSQNHEVFVVARANSESSVNKLLKIGANRVVTPHQIGGFRMANFALNPTVADFLDDIQDFSRQEIRIDDIVVPNGSPVADKTIAESLSNRTYGASILAIHKPDGNAIINPVGDTYIESGDRLILLGTKEKLDNVAGIITGQVRRA